jgi:hypothetical protein
MAMPYRVCIIIPPGYTHAACFLEVAFLLKSSLVSLGRTCDVAFNDFSPLATNIVLGYHLLQHGDHLKAFRYIPYQLEQLSAQDGVWSENAQKVLRSATEVWDYSVENIRFLSENGIAARHVPVGYHPNLEQIRHSASKDIDVLFYGSLGPRRQKVLDELRAHSDLRTEAVFGVYGKDRDACIARAKVVINVHFYSARIFEAVRISYLLNNRCLVVTEESQTNPYPDVTLESVPYERLAERCVELLNDSARLSRLSSGAYEQFRRSYPMTELLRGIVG